MSSANRPLSPHLQIYRPQLTSVLSILHRLTGIFLSAGAVVLVLWLFAAAAGDSEFAVMHGIFASILGKLFLLGWTFSLFYHLANGVRHLLWDAGFGFSLKATYATGWTVVGVAIALTALAWACPLVWS